MSTAETLYHEIADNLPDAKKGKMFGALCVKAPNGKAAVMFWKDYMIFKLRDEAEQNALSLDGAHYFSPAGDRIMNGWVQVPFDYADKWPAFAQAAMEYVKTLEK